MKALSLFGLFIILHALTGCKDDDPITPTCENYAVNLGPFYLTQSSKDLFPYTNTDSILIFKNQFNEELKLTQFFYFQDTFQYTNLGECPFDTTVEVPYLISSEHSQVTFVSDSLDLTAQFSFQAAYRANNGAVTGESDIAAFHIITPGSMSHVSTTLEYKSGEMPLFFSQYFETITLGTKTFTDVFSNFTIPQNPPRFLIYMNFEIGILGFEDSETGHVWVFDRIE